MQVDRRTLLYLFGIASVSHLLPAQAPATGKVVTANPGESRFPFSTVQQTKLSPCKLTSEDSGGTLSIFELGAGPQTGPYLHVHHREDEWYYVVAGDFLFKAGGDSHQLPVGGSIWLPRSIPHVWANTSNVDGKLILVCQPGGFEKFFEEMGAAMADANGSTAEARMKAVMANHGMELLGPPLFKPLRPIHG